MKNLTLKETLRALGWKAEDEQETAWTWTGAAPWRLDLRRDEQAVPVRGYVSLSQRIKINGLEATYLWFGPRAELTGAKLLSVLRARGEVPRAV